VQSVNALPENLNASLWVNVLRDEAGLEQWVASVLQFFIFRFYSQFLL
jgi:hypothetical protein